MPKSKRTKHASSDDDDYAPADKAPPNPGPSTRPRRARKATPPADADNTELLDQLLAAEERLMRLQDSTGQAGPSAAPGTKAKAAPKKRAAPAGTGDGNQEPKPKRGPKARKQQQQHEEGEEEQQGVKELRVDKRGNPVAYRPTMSQQVADRVDRALSVGAGAAHRLFLLDTKQITPPGGPRGGEQEFQVLGATGNVYKVVVSCQPTCSCPDFIRGNQCKHLLFCFLRVLRCARTDPIIWQKALLPSEVNRALGGLGGGGAIDQSALATGRVRDAYAALTGKKPEVGAAEAAADEAGGAASGGKPQRPVEGDCPVCYEEMKAGGEAVCTCGTCGNHTHKLCFDRWSSSKRSMGAAVTCVWCRAPWAMPGTPAKPAGGPAGVGTSRGAFGREYVNLAGALGAEEPSLDQLYQGYWAQRR